MGKGSDRGLTREVEKYCYLTTPIGMSVLARFGQPRLAVHTCSFDPSFQELESLSGRRTGRLFSPPPSLGGTLLVSTS